MIETLTPLIVVVLGYFIYCCHLLTLRGKSFHTKMQVSGKYASFFFFLTYFVLPGATTTIFGMFRCRSIDPDDLVNAPKYMRNDLSVSCSSDRYYTGFIWAIIMIFVYPVGILSIYFYALYANRKAIKVGRRGSLRDNLSTSIRNNNTPVVNNNDNNNGGEEEKNDEEYNQNMAKTLGFRVYLISPKVIGFLHQSYKPQFWYWEIIETMRRLLLTAILSVVGTGMCLLLSYRSSSFDNFKSYNSDIFLSCILILVKYILYFLYIYFLFLS